MKKKVYHSGIKRTSYEALFAYKPKLRLTTSFLPEDVLKVINTEEQLEKIVESVQTMEIGETNQIMQEKEPVSKNMHHSRSATQKCLTALYRNFSKALKR